MAAARTVDCCCVNRISQQGNKVSTDELLNVRRGLQCNQPVFAQRERGSFATSLPLIWSQLSIHWSCTAPLAGVMVSSESPSLHPMVYPLTIGR